ncbi:LytR/AlgR family response regulator transcription factor [Dyadobacter psychrotolerans]|uniref:Response regulator transcription factor n=1 Tax=Dyadobacter psychrotolerans TaxID=2541721 RepID=A0A4R5DVJ7_9BACT|nr:response regulator transcription factor [Dyadobacter psychrotolerans]TDE18582.1 response regulator transcription factor [Dyadobacter psychrotolerans]
MKILIVEDENIIAKHLQFTLTGFGYNANDVATDYASAIELLKSNSYDLAILDINLNGYQTGIDVGEYIKENLDIPFLFLTSHEDMAIVNAALKTSPNAFLNKPFQKITVYTAVKLAFESFKEGNVLEEPDLSEPAVQTERDELDTTVIKDALFIKEKHMFTKIMLADLLYIRSDDNYLELHTTKKKYTIRETMKNMISQLPPNLFFRVHKSFIINLNAITAINYIHVMIDDIEIPITSDNRTELLSKIKTFS